VDNKQSVDEIRHLRSEVERLKRENDDCEQIAAELRRGIENFEMMFRTMPIMIWQKDTRNRHVRISQAAAELEGTTPDAIEGKTAEELYPPEQAAAFYKDDLEVINSGEPKLGILERHVTAGTQEEMWLQTGKVPARDRNGEIVGVIAFAINVTHQKQAEEAVREARDKLQVQNAHLERAHEFFRSTMELLEDSIQHEAGKDILLQLLTQAKAEFRKLEQDAS
jgi:PAS domain S-box-containing protein